MEQNAVGQECLRNAFDVLNRTDLVIDRHYRDGKYRLIDHAFEGLQVYETFAVYRNNL